MNEGKRMLRQLNLPLNPPPKGDIETIRCIWDTMSPSLRGCRGRKNQVLIPPAGEDQ